MKHFSSLLRGISIAENCLKPESACLNEDIAETAIKTAALP